MASQIYPVARFAQDGEELSQAFYLPITFRTARASLGNAFSDCRSAFETAFEVLRKIIAGFTGSGQCTWAPPLFRPRFMAVVTIWPLAH